MTDSSASADDAAGGLPENLVEVGAYRSWSEGAERGLVVLAMSHPYWLVMADGMARLLVEPAVAGNARLQLEKFEHESRNWPPRPGPADEARPLDVMSPMLWAVVTLLIFRLQVAVPELTARGALDTAAIFQHGEWWRAGTALLLHADAGHVIANVLTGVLVFTGLLAAFGTKRGWALVMLAALAGNVAVAVSRSGEAYRSLGASTALFAALGLLTGRAVRLAFDPADPRRLRSVFIPLGAGLTMLGLYGGGAPTVDVGAHGFGFAAGLATGLIAARRAAPGR